MHTPGVVLSVHRIDTTDETERWRYRCPEGHSAWHPRKGRYYCESCDREFLELVDQKEANADV